MPALIQVDYTISGPVNTQVLMVDFEYQESANLTRDIDKTGNFLYQSQALTNGQHPYKVYPSNQYINVFVVALSPPATNGALPLIINLTFTKINSLTHQPIPNRQPTVVSRTLNVDKTGKYVLDENLLW